MDEDPHTIIVQRRIPIQFDPSKETSYFNFTTLFDQTGAPTPEYKKILSDRTLQLALSLGGPKENASLSYIATSQSDPSDSFELLTVIAKNLVAIDTLFSNYPSISERFYQTFTYGSRKDKKETVTELTERITSYKDLLTKERLSLEKNESEESTQTALLLQTNEDLLLRALTILRHENQAFTKNSPDWQVHLVESFVNEEFSDPSGTRKVTVGSVHPLFSALAIDFQEHRFELTLQNDILSLKDAWKETPEAKGRFDRLMQLIYDEVAKVNRETQEVFAPQDGIFSAPFTNLTEAESLLSLDLTFVANALYTTTKNTLTTRWQPLSTDLQKDVYPLVEWDDYLKLPDAESGLKLILYSPNLTKGPAPTGFKPNSIYVIAKDLGAILQKFAKSPNNPEAKSVKQDFQSLYHLLISYGFVGYPGSTYPLPPEYTQDYIFEAQDFYLPLLMGSREDFKVRGTKKFATLEFSTLKDRLLTLNRIETQIHEDLLKWRDEYYSAQVDPSGASKYTIPKPTQNVFLSNMLLSWKKYFRGDDRKTLRWGLDLTGGKTVPDCAS